MNQSDRAAWAAVILLAGLLGCPSPPPPGKLPPSGNLRGLFPHRNTMNWYVVHDGALAAVVFTDRPVAAGSGGHVGGEESVVRAHVLTSFDGDHVQWECRTTADGSGTLSVAGGTYDLAEGRVFLLRTQRSPPRVAQLRRDLRGVEATRDGLRRFADADPEVSAFLKVAEEPESWLDRLGS